METKPSNKFGDNILDDYTSECGAIEFHTACEGCGQPTGDYVLVTVRDGNTYFPKFVGETIVWGDDGKIPDCLRKLTEHLMRARKVEKGTHWHDKCNTTDCKDESYHGVMDEDPVLSVGN